MCEQWTPEAVGGMLVGVVVTYFIAKFIYTLLTN